MNYSHSTLKQLKVYRRLSQEEAAQARKLESSVIDCHIPYTRMIKMLSYLFKSDKIKLPKKGNSALS